MKTKKLDLVDFKQDELSREDISSVKAGEPINGKPPTGSVGTGSGETQGNITCYFTFDHEVIYCKNNLTGEIVGGYGG